MSEKYTAVTGIPLALGSILGSGLLFLPSRTVEVAGSGAIIGWVLATVTCFALIPVLRVVTKRVRGQSGLAPFLSSTLNPSIGNSLPLYVLATVSVGMPLSAAIAGGYARVAFDLSESTVMFISCALPIWGTAAALLGVKFGSIIQSLNAFSIFAVGVAVAFFAIVNADNYPSFDYIEGATFAGVAAAGGIAFWAFAGFENLLFMAGQFRNPSRDIVIVSAIAIVLCGALYTLLVIALLLSSRTALVESNIDLLALAGTSTSVAWILQGIGAFAVLALMLNFTSWIRGVSDLVVHAAGASLLPRALTSVFPATLALGLLLAVNTGIVLVNDLASFSNLFAYVSGNFICVYVLTIMGYVHEVRGTKKIFGVAIIGCLLTLLVSLGWSGAVSIAVLFSVICIGLYCK